MALLSHSLLALTVRWRPTNGLEFEIVTALIVRKAITGDAARIAEIQVAASMAAYSSVPGYVMRFTETSRTPIWRQMITVQSENEEIIVGENEGRVRAYAAFGRSRDEDAVKTTGELSSLYVSPDCWRSGFGAQMLAASMRQLTSMGFRTATLWVLEANKPARDFYERYAWKVDGAKQVAGGEPVAIRYRTTMA